MSLRKKKRAYLELKLASDGESTTILGKLLPWLTTFTFKNYVPYF